MLGLNVGDVADEEQGLEQQHVEGLKRAVVGASSMERLATVSMKLSIEG